MNLIIKKSKLGKIEITNDLVNDNLVFSIIPIENNGYKKSHERLYKIFNSNMLKLKKIS